MKQFPAGYKIGDILYCVATEEQMKAADITNPRHYKLHTKYVKIIKILDYTRDDFVVSQVDDKSYTCNFRFKDLGTILIKIAAKKKRKVQKQK